MTYYSIEMGSCFSKQTITSKQGTCINDIKSNIKPLDLIVFRGSEFVSDAISLFQKITLGEGKWTHVGLVVTTDIIPIKNGIPGKLYIWESTMSGKLLGDGANNVETNAATFGVQIRDLEDVVDNYDNDADSKIGWCKLKNNPLDKKDGESELEYLLRKSKISTDLTALNKKIGNATYDYNCLNLLSTVCCTCTKLRRNVFGSSNKYFCSELVAKIYQNIGIISNNIDSEKVAPEEFLGHTNDGIIAPVEQPIIITRIWNKKQ